MTHHMGICKPYHEHPMPTTPWGVSRAMVKDTTSHRITII
jgi:hypothetical protein